MNREEQSIQLLRELVLEPPSRRSPYGRGPADRRPSQLPSDHDHRVRRLRELASRGRLAEEAAAATDAGRAEMVSAAYELAWPIVYDRLTRPQERRRGHRRCAAGVDRMTADCLDRFHDDVESVITDLLAHARQPIGHLEGWIASRLSAATVDGYRRQRGRRGALQRPRLPAWLNQQFDGDPWLGRLAVEVLSWVGITGTAGHELWPLDAWSQLRGTVTGDFAGSAPDKVAREVDTVLAAMRSRPSWYELYVDRPLGHKQTPVAAPPGDDETENRPLLPDPADELDESRLRELAASAVDAIRSAVQAGEDPARAVPRVINEIFSDEIDDGVLAPDQASASLAPILKVLGYAPESVPASRDDGHPGDRLERFLVGEAPTRVRVGDEFSLVARIVIHRPGPGVPAAAAPGLIVGPAGVDVILLVHVDSGLVGTSKLQMTTHVPFHQASAPVRFPLRALREGRQRIRLSAYNGGTLLAESNLSCQLRTAASTRAASGGPPRSEACTEKRAS